MRRITAVLLLLLSASACAQLFPTPGPGSKPASAALPFPVGVTALSTAFTDASPPTDTGATSLDGSASIGAVVKDWGGGIFRTRTSAFVLTGGGHAGYGGNQLYQYTITDPTHQTVTRNNPTIPSELKCTNDGAGFCSASLPVTGAPSCSGGAGTAPNADHIYNRIAYFSGSSTSDDGLIKLATAYPRCGTPAGDKHAWKYVFSTDTWTDLGEPTYAGGMENGSFYISAIALVHVDDTHYYYWAVGAFSIDLGEYNPSTNTSTLKKFDAGANSMTASVGTYDPVHNTVIHAVDYGTKVIEKYDRAGNTNTTSTLDASCPSGTPSMGFSYEPGTGKIAIFPNSSVNVNTGNTFYLMDPVALTCTSTTLGGSTIAPANHVGGDSNGTFGRWQCGLTISGQSNVCGLINDYGQVGYVVRFI